MKAEDNRQRIIDAAQQLFAERGYSQTSLGDVADAAGLLKGNLSYYFRTKDALLASVTEARQRALIDRLNADLPNDAGTRDGVEAFLRMTEAEADALAQAGCPLGSLCSELGKGDASLQGLATDMLAAVQQWLVRQFAKTFPPKVSREHAEYLLAVMQGASLLAHAYRDPAPVRRQARGARRWLGTLLVEAPVRAPRRVPRSRP